jgi:hypothetical protein
VSVPDRESPRDRTDRTWVRAWLVAGLAVWLTIGVDLVDRANRQGHVADISFSPYHLVGYAGLGVLAVYVLVSLARGIRRGDWRQSFPAGYSGLGLGLAAIVGWVVLDPIWRDTIGIFGGVTEALAPTRLLIPAGLIFVASGPLREALAARPSLNRRLAAAGVVSTAIIGSALSWWPSTRSGTRTTTDRSTPAATRRRSGP